MLARCLSATIRGLDALAVRIEVDIAPGLPGLQIVGLADAAVQEARERVRAALRNSGLRVPLTRVVVSLAPADLRKEGPAFDLPIALGLLIASGQLPAERLAGVWSAAELGLDGTLRGIRGALALAMAAREGGARALLLPWGNAAEASLVEGLTVYGARNLQEALAVLQDPESARPPRARPFTPTTGGMADLADVQGAIHGRRALEIAAAGGHHLLLVGPPGSGKTMLARRLPGLLPPMSREEGLELTRL
ncbi:MAG: magnesium chelatase domain-containing protein, partial [Cyanobacteriota bacterium]|nr:magnesium chelatase domain-containing protein [Cyanobacteriota bacterium]